MPTFKDCAQALRENGYWPIPIRAFEKRPAIDAWQNYAYKRGDERRFRADAGVGLPCGEIRGVDIDVTRAVLAAAIRDQAIATWGACLQRVGQPPKTLLLVRTAERGPKLASRRFRFPDDPPGCKPHGVEILGEGQQLVAYGKHPDTRCDYLWVGADPLETPLEQLPLATEAELKGFLAGVDRLLLEAGGIPVGGAADRDSGERSSAEDLAAYNPEECLLAIEAIGVGSELWDGWSDWVYVGLAIRGALGEDGRAAWHAFSARSDKYDAKQCDEVYSGFRPDRVGAGTLYRLAREAGWARPEPPEVDISGIFDRDQAGSPDEPGRTDARTVDDILARPHPGWLVRNVLPKAPLALVYGQSGSGKSFLTLDIACSIARGVPWMGQRVKHGGVIVVAGEGHLAMRLSAYLIHHGLAPSDLSRLRIVNTNLDLRSPSGDLKPLLKSLRAAALEMGGVCLVVLDTLNAMMGGGDENESRDMGQMVAAARSISDALNCTALFIHHAGKDASRGARGHSSLKGALDFEIYVSRDGPARCAKVSKVRDGEDGIEFPFALEVIDIGPSRDPDADPGERDSSCVVTLPAPEVEIDLEALKKAKPLSTYAAQLQRLVTRVPQARPVLRKSFYTKYGHLGADAKLKAFKRALTELTERKVVVDDGAFVYLFVADTGET